MQSQADTQTPQAPGLTFEERLHLLSWIDAARGTGIDAIEDLRMRPWPVPMTGNVIGIFRAGEPTAAWVLVGQNGLWAVVSIAEGAVSAIRPSLAEALATVASVSGGNLQAKSAVRL
jgi:hypothetical protein